MATVTEVMIDVTFGNQVVVTAQPGNLTTQLPTNALVMEILQKTLNAVQNGDPSIELNVDGGFIVPSDRGGGGPAPAIAIRQVSVAFAGGQAAITKRAPKHRRKTKPEAHAKSKARAGPKRKATTKKRKPDG
jgi:hypothetical protein